MKTLVRLALALASAALVTLTCDADSAFRFDNNGNLLRQFSASLAAPQILAQPQYQIAKPAELASFFVVVADPRGLAYQWRVNGTNIAGATNDACLLTNVTTLNEGLYSVVLANSSGSVTSAPAMLWIDSDGDHLPDTWEQTYFGNLSSNPTGDFDGDGVSNLEEFLDGTNPAATNSALYRLVVSMNGGQVAIVPNKPTYTNGESVTLTATATAPEIFHGWTGDVVSGSNVVTLSMTRNISVVAQFQPLTLTWVAGNGSWNNSSNWSPSVIPTKVDDVIINGNITVTVDAPSEASGLTLANSAQLSGSSSLTLYGGSTWLSGAMLGSGRTVISPGGKLTINNSGQVQLGRILENAGTMVWTGSSEIVMQNAVVTNRPGGTFLVQNALSMFDSSGESRIDNAGIFRKTSGGTTTIGQLLVFNNYGQTEVQSGSLFLRHGGSNAGAMQLSAGTTLEFNDGTFIGTPQSSITGAGQLICSGFSYTDIAGLVNLSGNHSFYFACFANFSGNYTCTNNTLGLYGGTANFNGTGMVSPAVVNLAGGTMSGSNLVTVLNQMNWTSGAMAGSGRTLISSNVTLTINNSGQVQLNRVLENGGTIVWTGSSEITMANGVVTNRLGGLFLVQNALSMFGGSGESRIDNAGIFRKTSSGTSTIGQLLAFNNYGQTEVQSGSLFLRHGGANTGTMHFAAGTTLEFNDGAFIGSPQSSITGSGQLICSGFSYTDIAGLVNLSGDHSFYFACFANFSGNYVCTNNTLGIYGGTASFNGTGVISPTVFNLGGGTLSGSNLVTALNQMTWTGGAMAGSGRTLISSNVTLTITNNGQVQLNRVLENAGTIVWNGSSEITMENGVLTNRLGGLFLVQNALSMFGGSGESRIDNAGIFRKTSGGTTTIGQLLAFNNYGQTEVQSGSLLLRNGGGNTGTMLFAAGTTLEFGDGTFIGSPQSSITGAGQLVCNGFSYTDIAGLVDLNGDHSFYWGCFANFTGNYICTNNTLGLFGGTASFNGTGVVAPALFNLGGGNLGGSNLVTVLNQMNWSSGGMSGSGRTLISSNAVLTINNSGQVQLSRVLENAGTIVWTGSSEITMGSAVLTNRPGGIFQVQNAAAMFGSSGDSRFDNAGIFRKTSGGTTTIGQALVFNNYGTVEMSKGVLLAKNGYYSSPGSALVANLAGPINGNDYGRLQIDGSINLDGALKVVLTNGYVPIIGDTFTVLTAFNCSGTFSGFSFPSNVVTMTVTNTPNSVIVGVTDVPGAARPILSTPELLGTNVRVTWTAVSNQTYRVEYISQLLNTNWTALPGDIIGTSNTAAKIDLLTTSNRFYRVRIVP